MKPNFFLDFNNKNSKDDLVIITPLHPAIIHFPIAFLLFATVLSIISLCITRKDFMIATAVMFLLGSSTAFFSMKTGESAAEQLIKVYPEQKGSVEEHENAGSWVVYISIITTAISFIPLFTVDSPKINKGLRFLTVACAIILSIALYRTANLGGRIIYDNLLHLGSNKY